MNLCKSLCKLKQTPTNQVYILFYAFLVHLTVSVTTVLSIYIYTLLTVQGAAKLWHLIHLHIILLKQYKFQGSATKNTSMELWHDRIQAVSSEVVSFGSDTERQTLPA